MVYIIIISDVKLELPYLSAKLKACKPNWFLFGLGLGLKDADLKRIENQKQCRGVERCFSELLIYWLDGDDANINVLVNALKEVGHRVLAQKIQKKYEGVKWVYVIVVLWVLYTQRVQPLQLATQVCMYVSEQKDNQ